jgi:hypothetical protein
MLTVVLSVSLAFALACPTYAGKGTFADVPASHDYFEAIETLSADGVINGYPNNRFKPDNPVTRAEFAAMLCRAFGYEDQAEAMKDAVFFRDVDSHWAAGYINFAYAIGIVNGMGNDRFYPDAKITYEQVFKMVVSALGYNQSTTDRLGGYPNGYLDIANDLDLDVSVAFRAVGRVSEEMTPLFDGRLSRSFTNAPATRGGVAQILHNVDFDLFARCEEILAEIVLPEMSDAEKVKAVHDYLVLHARYDYENYKRDTIPDESYTARELILNGVGVCAAYADATKLLLTLSDVEVLRVSGKTVNSGASGGHAWNIVKLDGAYYHLDVTWDDPVPDTEGYVRYDYFAVSDRTLGKDHYWDRSLYPACGADFDAVAML